MKRALTIEAVVSDGLLQAVAAEIQVMTLPPESFVWSAIPGGNEARIWMVVAAPEATLASLAEHLRRIPGVIKVILHEVNQPAKGGTLTESLAAGNHTTARPASAG